MVCLLLACCSLFLARVFVEQKQGYAFPFFNNFFTCFLYMSNLFD